MIKILALKLTSDLVNLDHKGFLQMVNKEKQEKIKHFYRLEDSVRSLFAELIVRKTICEKYNIPNSDVEFWANEFGKPFLAGTDDFNFNVSHSSEWIVCAVGNRPLGVDIEKIKEIEIGDMVKYFFSRQELETIKKISDCDKIKYFYELWTLKESYVKAIGKGRYIPLNSLTLRLEDNIKLYEGKTLRDCSFRQFDFDSSYKMAICSLGEEISRNIKFITYDELQCLH